MLFGYPPARRRLDATMKVMLAVAAIPAAMFFGNGVAHADNSNCPTNTHFDWSAWQCVSNNPAPVQQGPVLPPSCAMPSAAYCQDLWQVG